jgi:RNA polymerase sigma-70 factor (ECF subfamily)
MRPDRTSGWSPRQPLTAAESDFACELFERHRLPLYRYLKDLLPSREDASEILQETYLRLLRQPSFDHVRVNARAYLFQTATNLARDLFRSRTSRGVSPDTDTQPAGVPDTPDWANGPDLALEGEQAAATITGALEQLSVQVRTALLLHRFREMTHQEIAARMNLSVRTIERYIKDGLTHIACRLKAES